MKHLLRSICLLSFLFILGRMSGQVIENRLNLSLGGNYSFSESKGSEVDRLFEDTSPFGHFAAGNGALLALEYVFPKPELWIGIQAENLRFKTWGGDTLYFLLNKTSTKLVNLSVPFTYFPSFLQLKSGRFRWGITASPILTLHAGQWYAVWRNSSSGLEYVHTDKTTHFGLKAGVSLYLRSNNYANFRLDIYHQFINAASPFYQGEAYRSTGFTLRYYFRLFKNRYFLYE